MEEITYEQLYDYNNLLHAWKRVESLKRYRNDIIRFRKNIDKELLQLQKELRDKTYQVSNYHNFTIYEPKKRLISSLPLRDRIVQHSLNSLIEPIIDKYFIFDSHACRKGHGVKLAVDRCHKFMKKTEYCLKGDISSYFPSIDHDILMELYKKKINSPEILGLVDVVIRSVPSPGLPIGNLLSQISANLYLHELDRFVKHELKIKYYIRYMDDFMLFHNDIRVLARAHGEIEKFLKDKLKLNMNLQKTRITPVNKGVEFCGSVCYPSHTVIKTPTQKRNRKRVREMAVAVKQGEMDAEKFLEVISSMIGHSMYSRNYSYRKSLGDWLHHHKIEEVANVL